MRSKKIPTRFWKDQIGIKYCWAESAGHFNQLNLKLEIFTGEGMVGVQRQFAVRDIGDANRYGLSVRLIYLKLHADLWFHISRKLIFWYVDDKIFSYFSVCFFKRNLHAGGVAFFKSFYCFFKTRDELTFSQFKLEGFSFCRCIKYFSTCQCSCVVYFDGISVFCFRQNVS